MCHTACFAAFLRIVPSRLGRVFDGSGNPEATSDAPTLGPDTTAVLMVFKEFKLNGCTSFPEAGLSFWRLLGFHQLCRTNRHWAQMCGALRVTKSYKLTCFGDSRDHVYARVLGIPGTSVYPAPGKPGFLGRP